MHVVRVFVDEGAVGRHENMFETVFHEVLDRVVY